MALGVEVDDKSGRQRFKDIIQFIVVLHQFRIRGAGHVGSAELEYSEQGKIVSVYEVEVPQAVRIDCYPRQHVRYMGTVLIDTVLRGIHSFINLLFLLLFLFQFR